MKNTTQDSPSPSVDLSEQKAVRGPDEIQVNFPVGMFGASDSDSMLDWAMREIGKAFSRDLEAEWADRDGTNFENDVFLMHPYCGCEKEGECPWCTGCRIYQERGLCVVCADDSLTIEQRRMAKPELKCDYVAGRGIFARFSPYIHDRDRHYYDPPNFWHKPSDFRVTWYKWIGRDMATNRDISPSELQTVFGDCMQSRRFIPRTA